MQSLTHLLSDYRLPPIKSDISISGLAMDSRSIKSGEVFLAYPGINSDGRQYISQAIAAGAAAVLYDPNQFTPTDSPVPCIAFPSLKDHLGSLAARWFNFPTQQLNVLGITGTNGKTSCSHFLAHCLTQLGSICGILGTLGAGFPHALKSSGLTTPNVIEVQGFAAELLQRKAKALAMEVSSHALVQGRVNSVHFDSAIFTNLTQDHLDYHGTMAAYGAAKAQLFHWPSLRHVVLNVDDPFGYALFLELKQQAHLLVIGYSSDLQALSLGGHLVRALDVISDFHGIKARVITPWGEGILQSRLIGRFHLHNLLAVLGCLGAMFLQTGLAKLEDILAIMQGLSGVPGRMQYFGGGVLPLVIVDYAHTPDALLNVLQTLRSYHPKKLFCVFGCGGDRDVTKRPLMGKIAADSCDRIILTNDNPRFESAEKIVQDIQAGIQNKSLFTVEYDRAAAITSAISEAKPGDIVLIAGKGHEDYQIIGNTRTHFSDAEQVILGLR